MRQISRSEILKRIGLVTAATVVALLLGEGLVRATDPYDGGDFPYSEEWNGISTNRPGVRGRLRVGSIFDVSMSFNQQCFRGPVETSLTPAPGVLRIATIGDSFTMGWGADDDQTYPARLQALLQKELDRPVEVLNAGVGSTGTGEQALYYQRWVEHFHPDIVVLGVNSTDLGDDRLRELFVLEAGGAAIPRSPEAINESRRGFRQFRAFVLSLPGFDFLDKHSRLFRLTRNVMWDISHRRRWLGPGDLEGALRLTAAEIRWLKGEVGRSGGRLYVVYMPQLWAIYPAQTEFDRLEEERLAAMLQNLCEQEQIPFSDLMPAMRAAAAASSQHIYYTRPEFHPTPRGYAVFAQQVAELVRNETRSSGKTPNPTPPGGQRAGKRVD